MLLAIDARNRSVNIGFREDSAWLTIRRFGLSAERSADEYAFFMSAAAHEADMLSAAAHEADMLSAAAETGRSSPGGSARGPGQVRSHETVAPGVDRAIISSVVPALTPRLVEAVNSAFGLEPLVLGPGVRTGIKIRTDLPTEVGADLVSSAVAARELVHGPCVIASFGAVLAFSALNAAGEFLGASLAPGLETAAEAIRHIAALIPEVRLETPSRAIGKNSAESVRSGLVLGYGGLVERIVSLMRAELGDERHPAAEIELIGTGQAFGHSLIEGLAPVRFVSDLALEGLALIIDRQ